MGPFVPLMVLIGGLFAVLVVLAVLIERREREIDRRWERLAAEADRLFARAVGRVQDVDAREVRRRLPR